MADLVDLRLPVHSFRNGPKLPFVRVRLSAGSASMRKAECF
jgi:hypothetical protein